MRNHSVLTLVEFQSREAALPREVYDVLRTRYAGKIDLTPTERHGTYKVAARDFVGRISLPGGMMLVIQPKVGVSNLFYMLCAAPALARFHPPPAQIAENPDILPFIFSALVNGIESLARRGLYKAYVSQEEDLSFVRGRINLTAQLTRYGRLKHRHVCRYADLTSDVPENRVVASTLRYLPTLLQDQSESGLVHRTRYLSRLFGGISLVSRRDALALLSTIKLHRLNAQYGPVLSLCGLALRNLTLDERPGPHPFASFLVDMPRLFESFLTVKLRESLPRYGLRAVAQQHDYLDEGRRVGIRPDVLVYSRSGATPLLVLDAKYRSLDDNGSDISRDLYQVSAYMDRYGLHHGVLVYPQFEDATDTRLKMRGTPKHLHVITLSLVAPDPSQLEQRCANLAGQIARLALGD